MKRKFEGAPKGPRISKRGSASARKQRAKIAAQKDAEARQFSDCQHGASECACECACTCALCNIDRELAKAQANQTAAMITYDQEAEA